MKKSDIKPGQTMITNVKVFTWEHIPNGKTKYTPVVRKSFYKIVDDYEDYEKEITEKYLKRFGKKIKVEIGRTSRNRNRLIEEIGEFWKNNINNSGDDLVKEFDITMAEAQRYLNEYVKKHGIGTKK